MVVRVVGVVLAVVVGAWFVLGALQARDVDRATAIVDGSQWTPAQARRAENLLDDARTLDPDRQVDVLRAEVDVRNGESGAARAILGPVVAAEPMNVVAWGALARAAAGDPRAFELALERVRELAPTVPAAG